jgi:hypothetical protein
MIADFGMRIADCKKRVNPRREQVKTATFDRDAFPKALDKFLNPKSTIRNSCGVRTVRALHVRCVGVARADRVNREV